MKTEQVFKDLKDLKKKANKHSNLNFIIDCNHEPCCPHSLENSNYGMMRVIEHQKMGRLNIKKKEDGLFIDNKKVEIFCFKDQEDINYEEYRNILKDKTVLNANILDQLIINPNLIPDDWYNGDGFLRIHFGGTIYADINNSLYVRCLLRRKNIFRDVVCCIDSPIDLSDNFTAILSD